MAKPKESFLTKPEPNWSLVKAMSLEIYMVSPEIPKLISNEISTNEPCEEILLEKGVSCSIRIFGIFPICLLILGLG